MITEIIFEIAILFHMNQTISFTYAAHLQKFQISQLSALETLRKLNFHTHSVQLYHSLLYESVYRIKVLACSLRLVICPTIVIAWLGKMRWAKDRGYKTEPVFSMAPINLIYLQMDKVIMYQTIFDFLLSLRTNLFAIIFLIIFYRMKKQFLNQIIIKFDQYVQKFLENKNNQLPVSTPPQNHRLYHYDQQMEKKLKLKTKPKYTNFEKLLAPMKELNSFVSIKQVLQTLGDQLFKSQQLSKTAMRQKFADLQPLDIKGVEMEKIEQYLTTNEFWQRRYNNYEFQEDINEKFFQQSDYKLWMEDKLQKICMNKKGCGFNKKLKIINNIHSPKKMKQNSLQTESYFKNPNSIPRQKLQKNVENQALNQHSQNFSKLSDVLTARLRKLLKTKQLSKVQKAIITSENSRIARKLKHGQNKSKLKRSINSTMNLPYNSKYSSKTSTICRSGEQWRNNINQRLRLIMADEGWGASAQILKEPVQQQSQSQNQEYYKFR